MSSPRKEFSTYHADGWDELNQECRGGGTFLGDCHSRVVAVALLPYWAPVAYDRHGPGIIVCLDRQGRRVGKVLDAEPVLLKLARVA